MRVSTYATVVEPEPGTTAVHSGVAGELTILSTDDWARVERFCDGLDEGAGLEELLEQLVQSRVLTDDAIDEVALLRSRYQRSRYTGKLGFTVVTSLGCNFDCPYCFEDKHPSKLKPEVADAIVQVVEDSPDGLPGVHVTWMGGEPLLASHELLALSTRLRAVCTRRGFPYSASIVTNGWFLDGSMAEDLAEHAVEGVQVTIDGPPDVHDRYRPHVNGSSTYERVIANVVEASEHLRIGVRVNLDRGNLGRVEELIADLAGRGLAGRIGLGAARMTSVVANPEAPVATYGGTTFGSEEFAAVELEFEQLAARYGFGVGASPGAIATPCTAVRATDVVVGSDGELWKCWDDIGDAGASIGSIHDYTAVDPAGTEPWLAYDPFSDPHCSTCVALPGCMGGCAHHLFHSGDPEERCGSFRTNHRERVLLHARSQLGHDVGDAPLPTITACATSAAPAPTAVRVELSPRRSPTLV